MDLHEFNTRVLGSLNIIDDGDGYLSRVIETGDGSQTSPFTVTGKRVVLPIGEHLRKGDKDTIVYHPLSENITRGESDMIKALRDTVMYELTMKSITLILELARCAATPSEHKRLNGPSGAYLKQVTDLDEKVYLLLKDKILMQIGPEPEKRLVSISLSKGNNKAEPGVLRSVKFRFPVLDSLLSDEMVLMGVKLPSQKARNVLRALFQVVLGDEDTRASFDYGSKNLTAPYFHALMNGFVNFATHLNEVVKKHKKLLGKELTESLTTDLSWTEAMDDLSDLRKMVPPQAGNEGSIILTEKDTKTTTKEVATKLLPSDRREQLRKATDTAPDYDEEPLPWEDDEEAARRQRRTGSRPTAKAGKSLDDFLAKRDPRYRDYRDDDEDRHSRRRSGYRDDYRDDRFGRGRSRHDDRRAPDFDLGLDRGGRDERPSRRDVRDRDRGFGRGHESRGRRRDFDDRPRGREFGSGHRSNDWF